MYIGLKALKIQKGGGTLTNHDLISRIRRWG
jgi:hypothetical protein